MEKEVILTDEGYNKLLEELEFLQSTKRREVAIRIKTAIEFGDISENSEYDDAKNEQAFIEGRICQINEALSKCRLIDSNEVATEKVSVGCRVTIKDLETGEMEEYRLVGSVEADPANHKISNESPVGKAIIGQCINQVVKVATPVGEIDYLICSISK